MLASTLVHADPSQSARTVGAARVVVQPRGGDFDHLTLVREATPDDISYIDALRKREGRALGFIPKQVYASVTMRRQMDGRRRWDYQRLLVTTDNGDCTGFCFASCAGELVHIFQMAIQADARRWHRALLLSDILEQWARSLGKSGLTCRVAYDLESNLFWRAIGYVPKRQVVSTWLNQRESKSQRPLWEYVKELEGLFP